MTPRKPAPPAGREPGRRSVLTPDAALSFPEFVLLKASAGSGKTHALSLRFVQLVLSERVAALTGGDLASILAITFTRNAAREMKTRILGWLKACHFRLPRETAQVLEVVGLAPEALPDRAGRAVDRILDAYTDLQVETIDSFMASVFKASAVDLGQAPDFEIVLEPGDILAYAFSRYLRSVSAGSPDGALFAGVLDRLVENQSARAAFPWDPAPLVLEKLTALSAKLTAMGGEPKAGGSAGERASLQAGIARAVEATEALIAGASLERNLRSAFNTKIVPAVRERRFTDLLGASFKTLPVRRTGRGADAEAVGSVEMAWTRLEALVGRYRSLYARSYYDPYLEVLRAFSGTLDRVKRLRGTVFIDDMHRQLAGYIRGGIVPDIYLRLGDRIVHYLVDEFQDTSPVQWENMAPLIENSLAQGGSLFVVGDAKQAIYGFRDADYRIMRDLEKGEAAFEPAAVSVLELTDNYRCRGRILDLVRRVFLENAARDPDSGPIAALSGLDAWAQDPVPSRRDSGYVTYTLLEKGGDKASGDEPGEEEEPGTPDDEVPEKGRVQELVRDILSRGWSAADIAVLTYKNENVVRVSSWLNEAGIPFIPFSSLDIRERKVVGEVLALLAFLDSPPDDLSFAAVLRGDVLAAALARDGAAPPPGTWDRFLFEHRASADRPLYAAFRLRHPGLWDRYFEPYFRTVGYYPLYDLVTQVYRGFGVFDLFPGEEASLVKLLEVIKDFEAAGRNDLRAFLELARDEEGGAAWTIDVPSDIEAVRVMSIHKAKGLGFPVVILLLYGEPWRPPEFYLARGEDGVSVLRLNATLSTADEELEATYRETKARDLVNRLNTLYVALTRAQSELHIVGVRRPRDKYPFNLIGGEGFADPAEPPAAVTGPCRPVGTAAAIHRFGGPFELPASRRASLNHAAVRRGEVAHAILAGIEFAEGSFAGAVEAAIRRARPAEPEVPLWEETGAALARYFEASPAAELFGRREARSVLREAEFCDAEGRSFRMDRVVLDPGTALVVDFKTGKDADPVRTEADREQVRAYMKLLGDAFPGRSVRGLLAFVDEGTLEAVE